MKRRAFLAALLAAPAAAALPLRGLVAVPPVRLPAVLTFGGIPWVAAPGLPQHVVFLLNQRNALESMLIETLRVEVR